MVATLAFDELSVNPYGNFQSFASQFCFSTFCIMNGNYKINPPFSKKCKIETYDKK